eukprot:6864571-Ditylum_brightwellii.AAC.1
MVESESCDGSNADMDIIKFIVFGNEEGKDEYKEDMKQVDNAVEINVMGMGGCEIIGRGMTLNSLSQ